MIKNTLCLKLIFIFSLLSFTLIYSQETVISPDEIQTSYNLGNISGRYVRITLAGVNKRLRLSEVEVYSNGENVALLQNTSQSTNYSEVDRYSSAVAVDSNRDIDSATFTGLEENPWWEVDLGADYEIDKIIVYSAVRSIEDFSITVSDSSSNQVFYMENLPDAETIVFMNKDLGNVWFIGDQVLLGDMDNDATTSVRSEFFNELTNSGYSFNYTGHLNTNTDGLTDTDYYYHSCISEAYIENFTENISSYWSLGNISDNLPNTICLMLGTNDIGDGLIDGAPDRLELLLDEIYSLSGIGSPNIYISSIPPNRRLEAQRTNVIIYNEAVQQLVISYNTANSTNIKYVNTYDVVDSDFDNTMNTDNFSPNGYGNSLIAEQWLSSINNELILENTIQDPYLFPGTRSIITLFPDYVRYDFDVDGINVAVIPPDEPAEGNPWMWRNIFYNSNTGGSMETDLTLIDEGYHVVIMNGSTVGHPDGNDKIKAIYDYLTTEHDFAPTFSASAMSRGNFMVFQYAYEYPEHIESIFMDNAVVDGLSWPAGEPFAGDIEYDTDQYYSGPGSEVSLQLYLDAYDEFDTFEGAVEYLKTDGSPIHWLEPLAEAGVPILSICGSLDEAVPYEENDARMKALYDDLGGDMTVIVQEKGHSHGARDNVEDLYAFIRQHTFRTSDALSNDYFYETLKKNLNLYPIPSIDILNVEYVNTINELIVYDLAGNIVVENLNINTNKLSINTTGYAEGLYLLQIKDTDGNHINTKFSVIK